MAKISQVHQVILYGKVKFQFPYICIEKLLKKNKTKKKNKKKTTFSQYVLKTTYLNYLQYMI